MYGPLLPLPWHDAGASQPEKRLMLAVLAAAMDDYLKYARTPRRKRFAEVRAWFESDEAGLPFSFVSLCHALDLEPSYMRAGLHRPMRSPSRFRRLPTRSGARHRGTRGS